MCKGPEAGGHPCALDGVVGRWREQVIGGKFSQPHIRTGEPGGPWKSSSVTRLEPLDSSGHRKQNVMSLHQDPSGGGTEGDRGL